jgi:hypothetical protein
MHQKLQAVDKDQARGHSRYLLKCKEIREVLDSTGQREYIRRRLRRPVDKCTVNRHMARYTA